MGRSLGRFQASFNVSTLLNPFALLRVVKRDVPAFWRAKNESTNVLLCGVEGPHVKSW